MKSILIKYFEATNKHFETLIAFLFLMGVMYFGIRILIYIGEYAWNVLH